MVFVLVFYFGVQHFNGQLLENTEKRGESTTVCFKTLQSIQIWKFFWSSNSFFDRPLHSRISLFLFFIF